MKRLLPLLLLLAAICGCRDQLLPPVNEERPRPSSSQLRIVYTRPGGDTLGSVRADGSDMVEIPHFGEVTSAPAGTLVAFIQPGVTASVGVANIDGSGRRIIYTPTSVDEQLKSAVGLAPTGDRVAFQTEDGAIRVIRIADGATAAFAAGGTVYGPPVFSPDGHLLAYCLRPDRPRDSTTNIVVADLDGHRGGMVLCENVFRAFGTPVAWSPDGSAIAHADISPEPGADWWHTFAITTLTGAHWRILDHGRGSRSFDHQRGITWSPNGREVAFAGGPDWGLCDIVVASVDGSSMRAITDYTGSDMGMKYAPQWSPDGSKILYIKSPPRDLTEVTGGHLMLYDIETSVTSEIPNVGVVASAYWSIDLQ